MNTPVSAVTEVDLDITVTDHAVDIVADARPLFLEPRIDGGRGHPLGLVALFVVALK